jgi:hypothetical protein
MFGNLVDALAVDPDLTAVIEAVEEFAASIGRGSSQAQGLA